MAAFGTVAATGCAAATSSETAINAGGSFYRAEDETAFTADDHYGGGTTYSTTDPFVTRDVDGAYTGEVTDGTWTAWQSLSGLVEGVNEFYHNISGSNEANFEFRYDWEYRHPESVGGSLSIGSRDGTQIHRVALADTSSSRLDYNHVRVLVGGTVYAVDVVDPTDENAIEWFRIGTPNYGIVCPRAYQTDPA